MIERGQMIFPNPVKEADKAQADEQFQMIIYETM